ncbi:hypothetical protein N7492_010036 [Penicillium capsulatum]|uniref:ER-bound oxygenase mpaB/mpaB'/Rubber oxygenase catalytic domain-containing protein n=1 Tax=Penicillium capsulatum TaxID=69766 RepID=A0A9W9HNT3_9EURO|nr:hypothetical protein N7492_010036 [Penicillium capsulatum]KAJ6112545.1 hypothetical protein N7512_007869 [Penicillium capsulatum]
MPVPTSKPGTKIDKWGYSFIWTEQHILREETDPLQYESDTLADDALERLLALKNEINEKKGAQGAPQGDLYAILRDHHTEDDTLNRFWSEAHAVPDWVDWEQIERGQKYFSRYALSNLVGFALQGFIAENSAASRVVEVLVRTGGFSTKQLLKRLLDTFQWLAHVTSSLPALQPGGDAHISTVRVRLLHASVRLRIRRLAAKDPSYFDLDKFGLPCNTLDSIHSISTFSCNQLWLQLPRLGIPVSQQETEDYVALFRYIAYLLGTPTTHFETIEKAKLLMESLYVHDLEVTETSLTVAYNFIQCVSNLPWPFSISPGFIAAGSRWLNGDDLADQLGLEHPSYIHYLAFAGQCLLSIELAWVQRLLPFIDDFMVKLFRNLLYTGLIDRKNRTRFAFHWVPQAGKVTGKEKSADSSKPILARLLAMVTTMGPIELVFLSFLIGHIAFVLVVVVYMIRCF